MNIFATETTNLKNYNIMKKSTLTLILCAIAITTVYAQFGDGTIAQPTHVVGKRINANGEVTRELMADFSYTDDGKLTHFDFPDFFMSSCYTYANDFLTYEQTYHSGGQPDFYETTFYTYDNGQIKTVTHSDGTETLYRLYSYYDDGRLEKKEEKLDDEDDYHQHWLYEYGNDGKTKTESYYWSYLEYVLRAQTTYEYDDEFKLLSAYKDSYNSNGEPTGTTLTIYTYTPSGLLETETVQALNDGEWSNTSIIQYVYDEEGRIVERLDGLWDSGHGEWDFNKRITFEFSDDNTYIVSFYQKNDDEWIWDVFNNQPILFGDHLKNQQRALAYMRYEQMCGYGGINQFAFTLAETNEPTYEYLEGKENLACCIHPNPTDGLVNITGKDLKQAEVLNMRGQCVATAQGKGETLHIDISELPAGVYFIRITDEEGRKCVRKVVKE